jgi:hypothetical protein
MTLTIPGATTAAALPTIDPGTVAGDILVTLTVPGQTPSTSTVTIEPAAPTIEAGSVAIVNPTATGFDVEFVATSSTREATIATFTFTPKSGYQITGNATISVPVGSLLATQWFSTAQSYPYGGSFTLTIPFTLTAGTADGIQSVSVTLANTINNSNAVSSSN